MTVLLPCPFCGGVAEIISERCGYRSICNARECWTRGPWPTDCTEEEAAAAWNKRAAPSDSRFDEWSTSDLAAQCRMQARDGLDPEYEQFMLAVSARLLALADAAA